MTLRQTSRRSPTEVPDFDVAAAYDVLFEIERRRRAQGWIPAGRKIGFTNRTIWQRYGVYDPIWAHTWTHTVHHARDGQATLSLQRLVQPRIEPEVVFGLRGPVPDTDDAERSWPSRLDRRGFRDRAEPFSGLEVQGAGLHRGFRASRRAGCRPRGSPSPPPIAPRLRRCFPSFAMTLRQGDQVIDRGVGSHVLDSPALALAHLVRVLADQRQFPALAAGEIVTTGTLTDAWPVAAGRILVQRLR